MERGRGGVGGGEEDVEESPRRRNGRPGESRREGYTCKGGGGREFIKEGKGLKEVGENEIGIEGVISLSL